MPRGAELFPFFVQDVILRWVSCTSNMAQTALYARLGVQVVYAKNTPCTVAVSPL